MEKEPSSNRGLSRRDLLGAVPPAMLGVAIGAKPAFANAAASSSVAAAGGPYNILFILVDQERHFRPGELPVGYRLPGHERLKKAGTSFLNHRINSCVCTPSRSVIYTGQHIQQTRMFDNTNFPWIQSMSTDMPTIGDMLRAAGYYTAYKGKWHLTKEFEEVNTLGSPTKIFTAEMEEYGFSDYFGVGDIIAHTEGGYRHDGIIAAMSGSWLRGRGRELAAKSKPWFLAVNLVNPHDVMFYDTDAPGSPVRPQPGLTPLNRDPVDPLYAAQWKFDLPATHRQPLDQPGRPKAHTDFIRSHDAVVAPIDPADDTRWLRRHNYYLNCMRDVDRNIATLLDELEASGQADRTIVIMTADHGDIDGAHYLHAKGATAYREQNNVPLIVVHPAYAGGRETRALTSHLDLAPTLVAMTGAPPEKKAAITKNLKGKDFSPVLADPQGSDVNAVRAGALFNFNMLAYLDGNFAYKAIEFIHKGGKGKDLKAAGIVPDLRKRGAIRSFYDGRHVYARYFSPKQHNQPTSLEQIRAFNEFGATAYGWLSGMKVDIDTPQGEDIEVDESFGDILDILTFTFMGAFDARKGRFVTVHDLIYLATESDGEGNIGPVPFEAEVKQKLLSTTHLAGYRVVDQGPLFIDLMAGGRITTMKIEAELSGPLAGIERESKETKIAPVIASRFHFPLGGKWGAGIYGDLGGFGVTADLSWQLLGTVQYRASDHWLLLAGWRHFEAEKDKDDLDVKLAIDGPFLGARYAF